ncbi:MAG: hypothetical protein GWN86_10555, partial [Desulfobacterales bacterium]|nr:hypothetical protein [Desulfobacterales bacterium]
MVILNLYGRLLLDGIRDIQKSHNLQATSKKHTMLLNAEGYWLSNPLSSESEFAFMYPERSGMKMSNTFPLAWKSMAFPGSKGFFLSPEGMYAFESINFMEREDPDSFIMQHAEQPWKLIVFVPTTELAAVYGGLQKKFLVPFTL